MHGNVPWKRTKPPWDALSSRRKRQVIDPEVVRLFRDVAETYARVMARTQQMEDLHQAVRKLLDVAFRKGRVRQTEIELLVREAAPAVQTVVREVWPSRRLQ